MNTQPIRKGTKTSSKAKTKSNLRSRKTSVTAEPKSSLKPKITNNSYYDKGLKEGFQWGCIISVLIFLVMIMGGILIMGILLNI